jgi:hypothetical protein
MIDSDVLLLNENSLKKFFKPRQSSAVILISTSKYSKSIGGCRTSTVSCYTNNANNGLHSCPAFIERSLLYVFRFFGSLYSTKRIRAKAVFRKKGPSSSLLELQDLQIVAHRHRHFSLWSISLTMTESHVILARSSPHRPAELLISFNDESSLSKTQMESTWLFLERIHLR